MKLETMDFVPAEAMEVNPINQLTESVETFAERIRSFKISDQNKEVFLEKFEQIKWALIPLLNKSISFGADQYTEFAELARKTNYSAQDSRGRAVIMFSDTALRLVSTAFKDTRDYLQSLH